MTNLGRDYIFGAYDGKVDYKLAYEWLMRAVPYGLPGTFELLGYMYLNGYGREKNPERALEWYRREQSAKGLAKSERVEKTELLIAALKNTREKTSAADLACLDQRSTALGHVVQGEIEYDSRGNDVGRRPDRHVSTDVWYLVNTCSRPVRAVFWCTNRASGGKAVLIIPANAQVSATHIPSLSLDGMDKLLFDASNFWGDIVPRNACNYSY